MIVEHEFKPWVRAVGITKYQLLSIQPVLDGIPVTLHYKKCKIESIRHPFAQGVVDDLGGYRYYKRMLQHAGPVTNVRIYGTLSAPTNLVQRLADHYNMSVSEVYQAARTQQRIQRHFWFKPFEVENPRGLYVTGCYSPMHLAGLGFRACTHPSWERQMFWLERAYMLRRKLDDLLLEAESIYSEWSIRGLLVRPNDNPWTRAVYLHTGG